MALINSPSPRSWRMWRTWRQTVLGLAGVAIFLIVWQLVPTLGIIDQRFLPYATDTLAQLASEMGTGDFWTDVKNTMTAWALGLLIATVLAIVLGTVIGLVPFLRRSTHTMVEFLRPIPSVALIPLVILLYGIQLRAALVIIVFASFWQVFIQVLYGVADVDAVARDTARSFGLSRASRFKNLVFPTTLPYLMTGIRLAAAVALILAITAEMTISNPGIGRSIILAHATGNFTQLYALVVATGLLGLGINIIFKIIERRTLSWHESVRGESVQ